MERARKILTNGLLAFVLISIGFAAGKRAAENQGRDRIPLPTESGRYVAVYYLHATIRCVTCNTIEKMTREMLDTYYSEELKNGAIQWIEDDYQKNDALAKQFKVVSSCVVVADVKDGVVVDYKRLDDVWTKMKDPIVFNAYVSEAIDGYLENAGDGS